MGLAAFITTIDSLAAYSQHEVAESTDLAIHENLNAAADTLINSPHIHSASIEQTQKINPLIKDVFLVLDNSGSMKDNDPEHLTTDAVTEFINGLDEQTRVGIIIFDQEVQMLIPLTTISPSVKKELLSNLKQINYKGLYTNSPTAMENAIYNLKNNARKNAIKTIIFMTDGIVDTGNIDRDLERTKWLKADLATDAADAGIKIFGIAFTETADFELIQSLAQTTGGEYYRVLSADALQDLFIKLHNLIHQPDKPVIEQPEIKIIERIIEQPAKAPEPIFIEVPVANNEPANNLYMMIIFAISMLLIVTMVAVILLRKHKPINSDNKKDIQEVAYLNDIQNVTKYKTFALSGQATMIGRVAGKDIEQLHYLLIPESTIGRRHALIEYHDFGYWITDQGSINGTYINGKAVTSETLLKHADIICLHNIGFEFVMPGISNADLTAIANNSSPHVYGKNDVTLMPDPALALGMEQNATKNNPDAHHDENANNLSADIENDATLMPDFDLTLGIDQNATENNPDAYYDENANNLSANIENDATLMPDFDLAPEGEQIDTNNNHEHESGKNKKT